MPAVILDRMPGRFLPSRLPATVGAICAVLALVAGLAGTPPTQAQGADEPLISMTLDSLDSATINGKGPLHVSGTITNNDDVAWQNVDVYPFLGHTPITTEEELAAQAALPDDAAVGDRITVTGDYTTIPIIEPHQTLPWSLTILRRDLDVTEPGVYWFGVHALLPNDVSADAPRADGRVRTFLPLVPKQPANARPEKVALVLPIRRRVLHQPDGRIAGVSRWTRDLADTGRLGRLLAFGSSSDQVTWLLDPAVLDAVRRLAAGNPPRNLGATPGGGSATGPASESPSPSPASEPSSGDGDDQENQLTPLQVANNKAAQKAAARWLEELHIALAGHEVLAVPYADPDLAAAAAHDAHLYKTARTRADAVLNGLGINANAVVAPPAGYLSEASLSLLNDNPLTLVSDAMIKGFAPAAALVEGHRLLTTSSAAASGVPGPGDPLAAMALRQRIVSEASLRLGTPRPLVVVFPDQWNPPGADPGFFEALAELPWLSLTSVVNATLDRPSREIAPARLVYPETELQQQLPGTVFKKIRSLIRAGRTLQSILTGNNTLAAEVLDEALTSASYAARGGHGEAAVRSRKMIDAALGQVHVEAPSGVTLAGNNGGFSVTVSNDLGEDVSVKLKATADRGLRVSVPSDVPVAAHSNSTITLTAHATRNGVHTVHLMLTDPEGVPLGNETELPIRSSQVSTIIWWFVGVGGSLLFVAIVVRLVRRVRAARRHAHGAALLAERP